MNAAVEWVPKGTQTIGAADPAMKCKRWDLHENYADIQLEDLSHHRLSHENFLQKVPLAQPMETFGIYIACSDIRFLDQLAALDFRNLMAPVKNLVIYGEVHPLLSTNVILATSLRSLVLVPVKRIEWELPALIHALPLTLRRMV